MPDVPALDPLPPRRPRPTAALTVTIGGRAALALTPGEGVVQVALAMPPLDRHVDVSVHPAAAVRRVADAAQVAGVSLEQAEAEVRRVLRDAARRAGAWSAPVGLGLEAALGGAAFPLLGVAYEAGVRSLGEVPRWAVPVLRAPDARTGARAAFGAAATRPVVRALAEGLVRHPGEVVDLARLALALLGSPVLEPDQLARVLGAPGDPWPPERLLDRAAIDLGRAIVPRWGAARTERVLVEAAASPEAGELLVATLRYARDLNIHAPTRLPARLQDLHDAYRVGVVTDPTPRPEPDAGRDAGRNAGRDAGRVVGGCDGGLVGGRVGGRGPAAGRAAAPVMVPAAAAPAPPDPVADRAGRDRIFRAPSGLRGRPLRDGDGLAVPPAIRALHGEAFGALRLVVPTSVGDLRRWGRALSNCLADYAPAAVAGTSTIVGVEREGALVGAFELRRQILVQFVGRANRPLPDGERLPVVTGLLERGLIDRRDPSNRLWFGDG